MYDDYGPALFHRFKRYKRHKRGNSYHSLPEDSRTYTPTTADQTTTPRYKNFRFHLDKVLKRNIQNITKPVINVSTDVEKEAHNYQV